MAKASDVTFSDFKEYILPLFAGTFPPKGTNFIQVDAFERFEDKMLTHYDYTPEREEFLIKQTMFYIKKILPTKESHTTCLPFLEKLLNKISILFSYYVMYKYPIPENGKSANKLRIRVQGELNKVLFADNQYIADLKTQQTKKQILRKTPQSVSSKMQQGIKRAQATAEYNVEKEINGMFIDAQFTPRKRR